MRFQGIKRFVGNTSDELIQYIRNQFRGGIEELFNGLAKLSFAHNFPTTFHEVTAEPGEEVSISHGIEGVPSGWITYKTTGGYLEDSTTPPTTTHWYLINRNTTTDIISTVVFFK